MKTRCASIAPPCLQNKKSVIGSHLITDFVALIVFYRDYPPIRPMYAGPIIMQKEVEIEENETVDSLKEKVQKAEQEIIVKAVDLFEKGKIKVKDNKVIIK